MYIKMYMNILSSRIILRMIQNIELNYKLCARVLIKLGLSEKSLELVYTAVLVEKSF